MPIVQLQDGTRINFAKTPTPADVDFAYKQVLAQKAQKAPVQDTPAPDNRNILQKGIGAFLDPIIESGVRTGQSIADAGLTGLNKITGGALDKFTPEGNLDSALQRAENTPSQVPITGTEIKPANEITTKDIAGNAVGTVALGVGSPALGGAMISTAEALKNGSTTKKVGDSLGVDVPESVGTAIDAVTGAIGGKILEHGFNAVAPYIEKAVAKYGTPVLEKLQQYVPDSAKGFMDNLASKFPNIAEKKILPDSISNTINSAESKISEVISNPIKTFKDTKNVKAVVESLNTSGNLTKVVNDAKAGNGGTLNLDGSTKELAGDYIVSVRSKNVAKDSLTEKDITDFIAENKDVISKFGNDVKIGTFDLGNGQVSIDINLALKDKAKALELAKAGQQQSVFDEVAVKNNPEAFNDGSAFVQTGFDGTAPKTMSIKDIGSYIGTGKEVNKALDAITPNTSNLTPKDYEKLLKQRKISPRTTTSQPKYILSDSEKAVAKKYSTLLQSGDSVQNSINVMTEIVNKDKQVGQFLESNNAIFNAGELKNYITKKLKDVTDIVIPESRVEKLKKQIINNFILDLPKKDMKSLWEARKAFDSKIETAFQGSDSLQKEIKREFRNSVQEFIADRTPNGVYKTAMKDMTELFGIENVLADKAVAEKGNSYIKQLIKDNPLISKVVGLGVLGYGGTKAYEFVK